MALVKLGLARPWYDYRSLQVKTSRGLQRLSSWAQRYSGMPGLGEAPVPLDLLPGRPNRFSARRLSVVYGQALAGVDSDHPVLLLFGAALRTFTQAGIRVLVYVVPVNVEHLRRVGLESQGGLARTVEAVRRVAKGAGADFLDLHDFLPDAAFRDPSGHFTYDGEIDGATLVAERIARALQELPGVTRPVAQRAPR